MICIPHPVLFKVIKLRRMKWVGHVLHMGEQKCMQDFGGETSWKETTWENKE